MGFNIEIVRDHILQLCSAPAAFGAVCVRSEGLRFEMFNGVVTTITPGNQLPSATTRQRNQDRIRT